MGLNRYYPAIQIGSLLPLFSKTRTNESATGQSLKLRNIALCKIQASALGGLPTGGNLPANQTVVDLVAVAVDPRKLSAMDPLWMGYL